MARRNSTNRKTILSAAACLLMVAGLAGCSKAQPEGTVQGTVTFEGKAVTNARIQLQAQDTGAATAAELDQTGKYRIEQPVAAGSYLVTITPVENTPPAGEEPADATPKARTDIPERYRSPGTSGLTATIGEGENTYDVTLTTAP